jgi:hypothetical protein
MTRRDAMMGAALLPLMLVLGAAGPISASGGFTAAATTPPPAGTPPADPGFEPAPVPDLSLAAPTSRGGNGTAPSVRPDLFTQSKQWQGNGFVNNSTAEAQRDSRMRPGAGFSISVPMQ